MPRTDTIARTIAATPHAIYQAFIDPEVLTQWLPPTGMTGRINAFEPRPGGRYRMTLTYDDPTISGKSGDNSDVVEGRFVELVPDERVVQQFDFASDDPAFAGIMTMAWSLAAVPGGTEVTIRCNNVPDGISKQDHIEGMGASLANLAALLE
jgi:uncharacterized protein YndB with AHSA1/START domain